MIIVCRIETHLQREFLSLEKLLAYVRSRFLIADQVISVLSNHVVSLCLVRSLFDAMTVSPALTRRRRPVFRRRAFSSLFSV